MKPSSNQLTYARTSLITAAALVAAIAFAPALAIAHDKDVHEDRVELRIKDMHAKLKITAPQEDQWGQVTKVMRDDAKTMDTLTQSRHEHAKSMTAVEDLTSYGEIASAHADGIKKLTPVFAALYTNMSDTQKTEADALFRHGDRKQANKH